MKQENPRQYLVSGLGNWGIAEGLVYDNWEIRVFDWQKLGEETKTEWQYKTFFGLDYGYTNDPTAFIAMSVNPLSREIYVFDEHYERKMLNIHIAEMIKAKGYAKERIRADAAEPKSNDDLRRLGIIRVEPSVKGKDSIINGISKLQEYKIIVHPACKNVVMELSSYRWKKDKTEKALNVPEDVDNHLMDAMRYAFQDVKFFKPQDPKDKPRPTPEQIYYRYNSVNSSDFGGF
jgi:phage terminase large subunit